MRIPNQQNLKPDLPANFGVVLAEEGDEAIHRDGHVGPPTLFRREVAERLTLCTHSYLVQLLGRLDSAPKRFEGSEEVEVGL